MYPPPPIVAKPYPRNNNMNKRKATLPEDNSTPKLHLFRPHGI